MLFLIAILARHYYYKLHCKLKFILTGPPGFPEGPVTPEGPLSPYSVKKITIISMIYTVTTSNTISDLYITGGKMAIRSIMC